MTRLVRPLDELRPSDEASFGGKSTSLGGLIAAGVRVPPGFAVSTDAFDACMAGDGLGVRIATRLRDLDPADIEAVNAAAHDVGVLMSEARLPDEVEAAVVQAYRALGAATGQADPPVAVRSSARGEDSADATFAGQQETLLWVTGADAVCDALRACWVSLYSPPAIVYRARLADAPTAAMGVTVQLMVDAAVAGVMFTCSPLTGDPSVIAINASWGLGLAVVGGEVTPDDLVVSRVTREVLRRTTSTKLVEYVPDLAGQGTRMVEVPPERRDEPCLADDRIPALVELARSVEGYFGARQDIEWAIARTGEYPENLFALQARPVTVAASTAGTPVADRAGASAMSLVLGLFGVPREDG